MAAQIQDSDKAITFLRRLKELVFLEKKNIARWEVIERAALYCGLDTAWLKKDMIGTGQKLFKEDLELAQKLDIKIFPTLFFLKDGVINDTIKGYQSYEKFEEVILQILPDAIKSKNNKDADNLFSMFHNMTEDEYSFLSDTTIEDSRSTLNSLHDQGKVTKYESKYGTVWMLNLNSKL